MRRKGTKAQRHKGARIGLTLIEVMLALVVIGTGLVALVVTVSRCLAVPRLAWHYNTARELFGVLEAEEPLALEEDIEDAAGSGTFEHPYNGYRWERSVEEVGEEEDGLWKVTTTIRWQDHQRALDETLVTYVKREPEK